MKKYLVYSVLFGATLAITGCAKFLENNVKVAPPTDHRVCDDIQRELTFNNDQTDSQDQGAAFVKQARLLSNYKKNNCQQYESRS